MKTTLTIDGQEYVRADQVETCIHPTGPHTIVISDRGWIFIGIENNSGDDVIHLVGASVVRRWDNGKGIGGLVKEANRDEYTLDPIGEITIHRVIATMPCEW